MIKSKQEIEAELDKQSMNKDELIKISKLFFISQGNTKEAKRALTQIEDFIKAVEKKPLDKCQAEYMLHSLMEQNLCLIFGVNEKLKKIISDMMEKEFEKEGEITDALNAKKTKQIFNWLKLLSMISHFENYLITRDDERISKYKNIIDYEIALSYLTTLENEPFCKAIQIRYERLKEKNNFYKEIGLVILGAVLGIIGTIVAAIYLFKLNIK